MSSKDTSTRVIKLKLKVLADTPEERKAVYKRLIMVSRSARRAANHIVTGQYMNDELMRRVWHRLGINPKTDVEARNKAEDAMFSKGGFLGTKRQATTERDIKKVFPDIPCTVTNPLNQTVVACYKNDKLGVITGERSLRTYRRGMPFPVTKASIVFSKDAQYSHITWRPQRKEANMKFGIIFGRDRAGNRKTVDRLISGEVGYGSSSFQFKDKNLFLIVPVFEPKSVRELRSDRVVGVDLGINIPAYVALSDKPERRQAIGFGEDFFRTRTQMQARGRRLQKSLIAARGGHGRRRKLQAMNRLRDKERNFVRTYNHMISKRVGDFAIQHAAGVIHLELLAGYGKREGHGFFLRNWSYFELQQMIKEKAGREGITVKFVDPYHTSQICSECGNWSKGQRDGSNFECKKCGTKLHADHNAAVNIARSTTFVTKSEQCRMYNNDSLDEESTAGSTAEELG